MVPSPTVHLDANVNLFNQLCNETMTEQGEIKSLFQWEILGLNRCLSPSCNRVRCRCFSNWDLRIDVTESILPISLNSLVRSVASGTFSTKDDDICQKCDSKPASHYIELFTKIPDVATDTLNRLRVYIEGSSITKVSTAVYCEELINFRGVTADAFDEDNLYYNLMAVILHFGSDTRGGHFVSYIFGPDKTVILIDDGVVMHLRENSEDIRRSKKFSKNLYICF